MEYTNKEIKEMLDTYYVTTNKIKQLIKDSYILTEKGMNEYYKIKHKHETLKKKLDQLGVKP